MWPGMDDNFLQCQRNEFYNVCHKNLATNDLNKQTNLRKYIISATTTTIIG